MLDVSVRSLQSVAVAVVLLMLIGVVTIAGVSQYKIHDFYGRMNSAKMIGKTQQQIRAIYASPTWQREDHSLASSHATWFYRGPCGAGCTVDFTGQAVSSILHVSK